MMGEDISPPPVSVDPAGNFSGEDANKEVQGGEGGAVSAEESASALEEGQNLLTQY